MPTEHTVTLILLLILAGGLFLYVWSRLETVSRERRKKRFIDRPIRPFDKWYADFYGDVSPDQEVARLVHDALAEDVGVDPSQIHPTDRYLVELYCPERWGLQGHELECLEVRIDEYLRAWKKRAGVSSPYDGSCESTVRETVLNLSEWVTGLKSPSGCVSGL